MDSPPLPRSRLSLATVVVLCLAAVLAAPPVADGAAGGWTVLEGSGFPREELPFVRVGDTFYLTGGLAKSGDTTRMQAYDPSTDRWTEVNTKFPYPVHHVQGVSMNGKIYYVGGIDGDTGEPVRWVEIYDPAKNTWKQGASLPPARARAGGGVAIHAGKIYFAGGFRPEPELAEALEYFDVYDPAADDWTSLPDMPVGRDHFHAQVVGGTFYALSGRNKHVSKPYSQNAAYTIATGTWRTNLKAIPTSRGGGTSVVIGDEIIVIGGEARGQAWGTVEAYDTSSNTWRTLPSMPTPRHGIQAVLYQGRIYVGPGSTRQGGGLDTDALEMFDPGGSPDTDPPTVPKNLSADPISGTRVDLDWSPSTDDTAVARYDVQRDGSVIASVQGATAYSDDSASPATTYSYRVRACDAANNCSAYSSAVQATTPDEPAIPKGTLVLGDEIVGSAADELAARGLRRTDGRRGRRYADADERIAWWEGRGRLPERLVIHLGAHGTVRTAHCRAAVREAPGRDVYLVTLPVRSNQDRTENRRLRDCARGDAAVQIIDWAARAKGHGSWFKADGVHLRAAGQRAFAAFVSTEVRAGRVLREGRGASWFLCQVRLGQDVTKTV